MIRKAITKDELLNILEKHKKSNKECLDLTFYDFRGMDLSELFFYNINFDNTIFDNCTLIRTNFESCSFKNASFINADIKKSILINLHFEETNLYNANLKETMLRKSTLCDCNMECIILDESYLNNVVITNCNIINASCKNIIASGVNFKYDNLNNTKFINTVENLNLTEYIFNDISTRQQQMQQKNNISNLNVMDNILLSNLNSKSVNELSNTILQLQKLGENFQTKANNCYVGESYQCAEKNIFERCSTEIFKIIKQIL